MKKIIITVLIFLLIVPTNSVAVEDTNTDTTEGGGFFKSIATAFKTIASIFKGLIFRSSSDFDFDVDVDPPIVTLKQDVKTEVSVTVRLIKGESKPVQLTITKFPTAGITSDFGDLTPSAGSGTHIYIETTCDTPPGEYLHTVQGEVGTRTSVDSVNVIVTENSDCPYKHSTPPPTTTAPTTTTPPTTKPPLTLPPIQFKPPTIPLPTAIVGETYEYSLCNPEITSNSDFCGGFKATINPTGGQPPYIFQLETNGGTPPSGILLTSNGILTGIPSTEEIKTFNVCAVDQENSKECQKISLQVIGRVTLTLRWKGEGSGTIYSNPAGLTGSECGDDSYGVYRCIRTYSQGTTVDLTVEPNDGSLFTGWSGACSGSSDCIIVMNEDKEVTANFKEDFVKLTIEWGGTGSGRITPTDYMEGDCENDENEKYICELIYLRGTTVNLAAAPNSGSIFEGWALACSGTGDCEVTMDSDKKVIADFDSIYSSSGGEESGGSDSSEGLSVTIDSASCTVRERIYGNPISFTVSSSGSASGPEGTSLTPTTFTDLGSNCGAWGSNCQRDSGEPESTTWNAQGNGAFGLNAFLVAQVCKSGCASTDTTAQCPTS